MNLFLLRLLAPLSLVLTLGLGIWIGSGTRPDDPDVPLVTGPKHVPVGYPGAFQTTPGGQRYVWTVVPPCNIIADNDLVLLVPKQEGVHTLTVQYLTTGWFGRIIDQEHKTTFGTQPGPLPNPGPGPNPGPAPAPDGKYGFNNFCYEQASALVVAGPNRASQAQAYAAALRAVAADAKAGKFSTATAVMATTIGATDTALGGSRPDWEMFRNALDLKSRKHFNKESRPEDIADGWQEAAAGLARVQ